MGEGMVGAAKWHTNASEQASVLSAGWVSNLQVAPPVELRQRTS